MDVPVSDPEAILILISSCKMSKGIPGTLDVYCSSVVFPLLLLLLLLSVVLPLGLLSCYSSISLSSLLLDEDTTISDILKIEEKPKRRENEDTWL